MKKIDYLHKLPIIGSIATMPTRNDTFREMLPAILEQVDRLYVYLDGFKEIPTILQKHPKIYPMLLPKKGGLHTCSRFLAPMQFRSEAIIVFFDDDIQYPSDYVEKIKNALVKYGRIAVVGFHGRVFRPPHVSYARDCVGYHFSDDLYEDLEVHLLGTGTAAFLSSAIKINPNKWRYKNMADLYLAAEALNSNLKLIALKREPNWLKPLAQDQEDSIWSATKKDDSVQSSFMRNLLLQHAMLVLSMPWIGFSKNARSDTKFNKNFYLNKNISNLQKSVRPSFFHAMENSIINKDSDKKNYLPYSVGRRKRYATCSGVAWITEEMLAVVNLYGQHLRIYKFDSKKNNNSFSLIEEITVGMNFPESVAVSPDKTLLAISHTMSPNKGISLHRIKIDDGFRLMQSVDIKSGTYHSLSFSPNSRFLVATEIGTKGFIEVIDVNNGETKFSIGNSLFPLKPKSASVTPDGRFVAIISSTEIKPENLHNGSYSVLSFHNFDQNTGWFHEKSISEIKYASHQFVSLEDSCIFENKSKDNAYYLLAVDQANDEGVLFEFDPSIPEIRVIGPIGRDMSFPHGIDVCPRTKYIATANYGDDSLKIFKLPKNIRR